MNVLLKFVCLWTMPNLPLQCNVDIYLYIYGVQFCTNMTKNENDDRSVNHFSWSAVLKSSHVMEWQMTNVVTTIKNNDFKTCLKSYFLYAPKLWTVNDFSWSDDRSVNHFSWSAVLKSSHVCRDDKWLTSWQQYKTMTF